ncbi:calcium/calmodulin-dependent protein kinase type II subunit alpha-like isoform X3 [Ptychodera flava]|uniref:calcium/calmodulin-dependent protein kinase type II subunit alpha-like isoform X3 n=1 Tax=Ptychodera flava TaxID=63121 RepID=UPI003969E4D2
MMSEVGLEEEVINVTKDLLSAIDRRDFKVYRDMTMENVSCFERGTMGDLVEGLDFHEYYFDKIPPENCSVTIINPRVHVFGPDAACIAYVRLRQRTTEPAITVTFRTQETRVWQRIDGKWKVIHFHSTPL